MNAPTATNVHFRTMIATVRGRWRLLACSAAVMTLLALAYALIRQDTWEASQALVVRDEAMGNLSRPGRFDSADSRKTAQETLLEIARNANVVAAALKRLGPPPERRRGGAGWPSEAEVRDATEAIAIRPPRGLEFGMSEVIYVIVRQPSRPRALALAGAISDSIEARLQSLRNTKAQSVTHELERTVALARKDLDATTARLQTLEGEVGSDLGELRTLAESGSGEGNLRTAMNKIKEELRQARANDYTNQQQLALLKAARVDPQQLSGLPNAFFEGQPTLRRLNEGLVEAQIHSAQALGRLSDSHPHAQAAVKAEANLRKSLEEELQTAIGGMEANARVSNGLVKLLETQLTDVQTRLNRLAQLRAPYTNLVAELRQRAQTHDEAQRALADARASRGAAQTTSLITRIDPPQVGSHPIGPGRLTIVVAGLAGGLLTGAGLVALTATNGPLHGRRWGDYLSGRRAGDRRTGRRATDPITPPPVETATDQARRAGDVPTGRRASDQPAAQMPRAGRRATDAPLTPPSPPMPIVELPVANPSAPSESH